MRRLTSLFSAALLVSLFIAPLAARQATTAPAAAYDVIFEVQGEQYIGATTFMADKAGKVSGTMKLTTPNVVDAKLNGTVTDGVWKFVYDFTMNAQGQVCSGTVSGTAKVTPDTVSSIGDVSIGGSCSPDALVGVFKFTKKK